MDSYSPPKSPSPEFPLLQSPPSKSYVQSHAGTPAVRSGKRDLGILLKETLDARYSRKIEVSLKRHKAEMELKKQELEIKRETIAANERIVQIQADTLAKQADAQAKQADAQARQAESFIRLMERMLRAIKAKGKGENQARLSEATRSRSSSRRPIPAHCISAFVPCSLYSAGPCDSGFCISSQLSSSFIL